MWFNRHILLNFEMKVAKSPGASPENFGKENEISIVPEHVVKKRS